MRPNAYLVRADLDQHEAMLFTGRLDMPEELYLCKHLQRHRSQYLGKV